MMRMEDEEEEKRRKGTPGCLGEGEGEGVCNLAFKREEA